MPLGRWGDGGLYGDGALYNDFNENSTDYVVEQEVQCHRLSVRLTFTPSLAPGTTGAFRIHDVRVRLSPIRQGSFTHEAFFDLTTPSQHLSAVVKHSGSEFVISNVQLFAQRKKHQPIG
jgi:hypothetical protein